MLVDLDTSQNMLSAPGTIAASPMSLDSISPLANASSSSLFSTTTPLVLWNGSTDLASNPDLYKAQLDKIGQCIDERNKISENMDAAASNHASIIDSKSSGVIVNGCGWIEEVGYKLMLHTLKALKINVVLVMGDDRLYSMLNSHCNKLRDADADADGDADVAMDGDSSSLKIPKVIKLPRSGGVVSRDSTFRRVARSLSIKRYFYGESIRNANAPLNGGAMGTGSGMQDICPPSSSLVHQYTPTRLEIPFGDLTLYRLSSVSLSASMLPVSAKQATDPVQLTRVEITPTLKHGVLAVCHPNAADQFRDSGEARDLYLAGISGLVTVEKVDVDREIISLLSPGGSLSSSILLIGDITWME
jgi:polyribonucleotide 5'-hydroxyl-kinase